MAEDDEAEDRPRRSARTDKLWSDVGIDPIEVALPRGVGYTLRAYRSSAEVAKPEIERDDAATDDFEAASAAVLRRRRADDDADEDEVGEFIDFPESDDDEDAEDDDDTDEEGDDEKDLVEEEQEVPVFLGRKGRVYLFHSPDKLVEFVKSDAEHDLTQLDTWTTLAKRLTARDVVAADDDTYELDLVVENLRGGADAWDAPLILKAGELARDLGFALRIESVMVALSPGSPLDDLDEALRATTEGGVKSFLAKRRLRKIPAQQSSLAWRTVIGKISAVAQWQD